MRGDMRPDHDHGAEARLQRDSSSGSGSSSPQSTNDDDVIEVNDNGFVPKPIYNFSIPDVIKHDHRSERMESRRANNEVSVITSRRKRTYPNRNNNSGSNSAQEFTSRNKRQKRLADTSSVIPVACSEETGEDDDDNCHRRPSVAQVIDLTDLDDDYNAHSDSEVNRSTRESRPLRHLDRNAPFREYLSNLETFHRQLRDSRDRVQLLRSSSLHGLQRLRRRRGPIITDGPLITSEMLSSAENTPENPTHRRSLDDSVTVINEIAGNDDNDSSDDDHRIALRMLHDPTYSPPYHTPRNSNTLRHPDRSLYSDDTFRDFENRLRALRSRSNERLEQARRISEQARERLSRIHASITNLRHSQQPSVDGDPNDALNETTNTNNNTNNNNNNNNENDTGNEVEFVREWNPNSAFQRFLPATPLGASLHSPDVMSGHLSNFPDFLVGTLFQSSIPQPRLQHLHHYEELLNLADRLGPAKHRGLSKSVLDRIPSFRFSKETAKETNSKCVICMSEYSNREKVRRLPCTHDFHAKCIDKWLKSTITCPICRDEVNPTKES